MIPLPRMSFLIIKITFISLFTHISQWVCSGTEDNEGVGSLPKEPSCQPNNAAVAGLDYQKCKLWVFILPFTASQSQQETPHTTKRFSWSNEIFTYTAGCEPTQVSHIKTHKKTEHSDTGPLPKCQHRVPSHKRQCPPPCLCVVFVYCPEHSGYTVIYLIDSQLLPFSGLGEFLHCMHVPSRQERWLSIRPPLETQQRCSGVLHPPLPLLFLSPLLAYTGHGGDKWAGPPFSLQRVLEELLNQYTAHSAPQPLWERKGPVCTAVTRHPP